MNFVSFIDLNGKKDLALMQQACGSLVRDTHKLLPPYMGRKRLQSEQQLSLPHLHSSGQRQLADPSAVLVTAVSPAVRQAGEPGNSWEINALSDSAKRFSQMKHLSSERLNASWQG